MKGLNGDYKALKCVKNEENNLERRERRESLSGESLPLASWFIYPVILNCMQYHERKASEEAPKGDSTFSFRSHSFPTV